MGYYYKTPLWQWWRRCFRLKENDKNLVSLHELFSNISSEPLIAQEFLPDVKNGDKRIILVDGEPVGAINRVPLAGETRSNMHVGGQAQPVKLTERIEKSAK